MAVEPRLLNPTTAIIGQKAPDQTRYDHRRRSPVNRVAKTEDFTIQCQVKWNMNVIGGSPTVTQAGVNEQEAGYILVRTKDLKSLGKTIKKDDRIKEVGGIEVDLYVLRLEYGSHYGGEFKLVKIHFTDRRGKEV